uniref:Uncharacterized protein n=1 Tax=Glossina brevipalpis TaxID=37001 RepID=A0A1A9WQU6_9MUSC
MVLNTNPKANLVFHRHQHKCMRMHKEQNQITNYFWCNKIKSSKTRKLQIFGFGCIESLIVMKAKAKLFFVTYYMTSALIYATMMQNLYNLQKFSVSIIVMDRCAKAYFYATHTIVVAINGSIRHIIIFHYNFRDRKGPSSCSGRTAERMG